MRITETVLADGIPEREASLLTYLDWRDQQTTFEDLAAFKIVHINVADTEDRPERYLGTVVTANVFSELNARPLLGRVFSEEESSVGAPLTIVISFSQALFFGGFRRF